MIISIKRVVLQFKLGAKRKTLDLVCNVHVMAATNFKIHAVQQKGASHEVPSFRKAGNQACIPFSRGYAIIPPTPFSNQKPSQDFCAP